MPSFNLYQPSFDSGGDLLRDPVIPAISGLSIVKVAVTIGIFVWLFRKLGR